MTGKRYRRNALSGALFQALTLLSGFLLPAAILRAYGERVNGMVATINSVTVYFSLAESGISAALVFELYRPLTDSDRAGVNAALAASAPLYRRAGLLFAGLSFAFALGYPLVFPSALPFARSAALILALCLKNALEIGIVARYRSLLIGDQRTHVVALCTSVYLLLYTSLIILLTGIGLPVEWVFALGCLPLLLRAGLLLAYTRRRYPWLDAQAPPEKNALPIRGSARYAQFLGAAQRSAPVLLAGAWLGMAQASAYSLYHLIPLGIDAVLTAGVSGVTEGLGHALARGDAAELRRVYPRIRLGYCALTALLYGVAAVMTRSFLGLYAAAWGGFSNSAALAALFSLNGLLFNVKIPQGMLVQAAGHYRQTRGRATIQALLILVAGSALARPFGIAGIICACCLSNLYRSIDLAAYAKRITGLPARGEALAMAWTLAAWLAVVMPFALIRVTARSWGGWCAWALAVTAWGGIAVGVFAVGFYRGAVGEAVRWARGRLRAGRSG